MWCDHLFSQRNNTIKRAMGVDIGGEGGSWTKFEEVG